MVRTKECITERKEVTIITGFLGAGKTSFLNRLIDYRKGMKPVIIENEFGREGIDAGLIVSSNADIFEFNNGCLCCHLNEEFYDLLNILHQRKDEFDELIIETTGIADPATVARPFYANPFVEQHYSLKHVICMVDARLIETELAETVEARQQIVFADIVLINKCETVTADHIQKIKILVQHINPFARVFTGSMGTGYPLKSIMALSRDEFDNMLNPDAGNMDNGNEYVISSSCKAHQHHDICSLSFVFDEPFDISFFHHRLWIFLRFQAKDIYRVKGFVFTNNSNRKMLVQSVSNTLKMTTGIPWGVNESRKSRLVFIGRDIQSKGIENMLRQCLLKNN